MLYQVARYFLIQSSWHLKLTITALYFLASLWLSCCLPEQLLHPNLLDSCSMHRIVWFILCSLAMPALSASNASLSSSPCLLFKSPSLTTKSFLTEHLIPQYFWPVDLAAPSCMTTVICMGFPQDACNMLPYCYMPASLAWGLHERRNHVLFI